MKILHETASRRALAMVRGAIFGLWAVKLLVDPLEQLAQLPFGLFEPPAPLSLLSHDMQAHLMNAEALRVFRIVGVCLLALTAAGRWFVWLAPLCCLLLTMYQSLVRGFGHINHAELAPLLA